MTLEEMAQLYRDYEDGKRCGRRDGPLRCANLVPCHLHDVEDDERCLSDHEKNHWTSAR